MVVLSKGVRSLQKGEIDVIIFAERNSFTYLLGAQRELLLGFVNNELASILLDHVVLDLGVVSFLVLEPVSNPSLRIVLGSS